MICEGATREGRLEASTARVRACMCVCVFYCVRELETGSAPRGNRSPYLIWGGGVATGRLTLGLPVTLCVRVWGGLGGVLPTPAALAGPL